LQPDSLIPDPSNPQAWNRFSYGLNNPVNFNDPTGHRACGSGEAIDCDGKLSNLRAIDKDKKCGGKEAIMCDGSPKHTLSQTEQEDQPDYIDPGFGAIADFWDNVVSPFADGLSMEEAYVLASSKWYKTPVWSLPTAPFEAVVAGYRQGYRDSWWEGYTPVQRTVRVAIVMTEAYAIDAASSATGTLAGMTGGVATPAGAFAAYGVTAYATSKAGYDLSASINRWLFPTLRLGLY
jgi:hypothetical protein